MSRAVHPKEFLKVMTTIDTFHSGLNPIPFVTFSSELIEFVRMMAYVYVFRLSPLQAIQRRAWMTASSSVVKLQVETV